MHIKEYKLHFAVSDSSLPLWEELEAKALHYLLSFNPLVLKTLSTA